MIFTFTGIKRYYINYKKKTQILPVQLPLKGFQLMIGQIHLSNPSKRIQRNKNTEDS